MILRIIPYLLIIFPVIGFFYTPAQPPTVTGAEGKQMIANLAYLLFSIPWWGKLLSMLVGVVWIAGGSEYKEKK